MKFEDELPGSGLMLEAGHAVAKLEQLHHPLGLKQDGVAVLGLGVFPPLFRPRCLVLKSIEESLLLGFQGLKGSPQSSDLGFESLLLMLLVDSLEEVEVGDGDVAGGAGRRRQHFCQPSFK